MQKSQSLPRIPGAKRQHFPKIRVVALNDAKHIALREQRLGIQLTEKPRKKTPEEVLAEIDEMFLKQTLASQDVFLQEKKSAWTNIFRLRWKPPGALRNRLHAPERCPRAQAAGA